MLDFVKKLFKKEKEIIKLNIDQVNQFLKEKGFSECNLSDKTNPFFGEIKSIISDIRLELTSLEKAELRNPNIDPRALQLMEGNRISYIKKTEIFVNSFNIPENCNIESLETFVERYKHEIESFNKATIRSFYIVSEFFKNHTQNIAQKIKKIDDIISKLNEILDNEPSRKASKILSLLDQYNEINEKRISIDNSIKDIENQIISIDDEIKKINNKEIVIKTGPSYKELSEFLSKKENFKELLNEEKKIIYDIFSKIEPGLKKLDYILPEDKLLKNYLNDPTNALVFDTNLEILNFIKMLKESLDSGKIDLKDKKKENVINTLNMVNKEFFSQFLRKYNEIISEINSIDLKINNFSIGRSLSELDYRKEHLNSKKERLVKEKDSIQKALQKNDNEEIFNEIRFSLQKLTDSEIILLINQEEIEQKN